MIHVLGHGIDVLVVRKRVTKERLASDHEQRHLVFLEGLAGLFDIGAVVARFVGHKNDQEPAVLADQGRIMVDDLANGMHRVFDSGGVDFQMLDAFADQVDVVSRLFKHIVDPLSEPDDRVVQGPGRLLAGLDIELELARDAVELLKDRPLVVLHAR